MRGPFRPIVRRSLAALSAAALASAVPVATARAACTWVESVTDWDASVSWTYNHQASWSQLDYQYEDGRATRSVWTPS
jgi:hypothetical protein